MQACEWTSSAGAGDPHCWGGSVRTMCFARTRLAELCAGVARGRAVGRWAARGGRQGTEQALLSAAPSEATELQACTPSAHTFINAGASCTAHQLPAHTRVQWHPCAIPIVEHQSPHFCVARRGTPGSAHACCMHETRCILRECMRVLHALKTVHTTGVHATEVHACLQHLAANHDHGACLQRLAACIDCCGCLQNLVVRIEHGASSQLYASTMVRPHSCTYSPWCILTVHALPVMRAWCLQHLALTSDFCERCRARRHCTQCTGPARFDTHRQPAAPILGAAAPTTCSAHGTCVSFEQFARPALWQWACLQHSHLHLLNAAGGMLLLCHVRGRGQGQLLRICGLLNSVWQAH